MKHRDILFVGSIPLKNSAEVFSVISDTLGNGIKRIPDGETGKRLSWLGWQDHVFQNHPDFETVAHDGDHRDQTTPDWMKLKKYFKLKEGIDPKYIEIGPLQYAENAIASYEIFLNQRKKRPMLEKVKFQVAIPSPFNILNSAIYPKNRLSVEPRYEIRLKNEIEQIISEIPASDLAIQWDCAHDMQAYDHARPVYFESRHTGITERLVRIGDWIPENVELGYHFCYGSLGGKHFVEPKSIDPMVELANNISQALHHKPDWIHMPVPVERHDDEYFKGLLELRIEPKTTLYLGLIHDNDGILGTKKRIATAEKFRSDFGIATECGFGRREAGSVLPLIKLHREIAETD